MNREREKEKHIPKPTIQPKPVKKTEPVAVEKVESKEFRVQVMVPELNVRVAPTLSAMIIDILRDSGEYTIVERQGEWGKLAAGRGWIRLVNTKEV